MTKNPTDNFHIKNQIVDKGLCVRCGACEPACPVDIIKFDVRTSYPFIIDEKICIRNCKSCLNVCPGEYVDFSMFDDQMFGISPHPGSITGIAKRALVSFAKDEDIRSRGTSGGVVTQILLYMMKKNLIDGALVLKTSKDNGYWQEQSFIARNAADLKSAMKSKYIVTPLLRPLKKIIQNEGKYAVVGLPCHIHALRKYQQVNKKLKNRIKLIIGLHCNTVFEPNLFTDICEFNNYKKEDVREFHFRYGNWPGTITAESNQGSKEKVLKFEEYKDEINVLKLCYAAPRCNMCIDFTAEYADFSVADPWLRGPDGNYLFENKYSCILVRTPEGNRIINKAAADGYLEVKEIPLNTYMVNFESIGRFKRDLVPKIIKLRKLLKLPVPKYNREIEEKNSFLATISVYIKVVIQKLSKFKWFRKLILNVMQSRLSLMCLSWNRNSKKEKFALNYQKRMQYVKKIMVKTEEFNHYS